MPVGRERALRGGNRTTSVFLISQSKARENLAIGRPDDVHDLLAVRGHERAIDVVRREGFHVALRLSRGVQRRRLPLPSSGMNLAPLVWICTGIPAGGTG